MSIPRDALERALEFQGFKIYRNEINILNTDIYDYSKMKYITIDFMEYSFLGTLPVSEALMVLEDMIDELGKTING